ncbi:MAG: ATP-binding protein [Acidimicrobiaceae bacterium]|nr:ATP-binding protein [Acidimicrobiaceae bacterium]
MPDDQEHRYEMGISLNVLDHLGLNLYSNTPAVISEAIANAWDADATQVEITLDPKENSITVADNGHGMDLHDVNNRYLLVGYRRRDEQGHETPNGRKPMGRKGIGKLSLFSIAHKIFVFTTKAECDSEAFLMDANEIRETVQRKEDEAKDSNDPRLPRYNPTAVEFAEDVLLSDVGTTVKITDLKRHLTQASVEGLRKRIARRFGLLADDFKIFVNGDLVDFSDRDYFHKARFIFRYGDYDYSSHCPNLDREEETNKPLAFLRTSRFDAEGKVDDNGPYRIEGWIAIARHSNDLDDRTSDRDDNLNKITILMRGRVAQEDILQEYRLGGMITKYIFGEIHADFLDDDEDDIATTSRQRLAEDEPRYLALKSFIEDELRYIWTETNKLKAKREFETALNSNPHVKQWYDNLPTSLKKSARSVFRGIDVANMDEQARHNFYATAVLGFEHLKIRNALNKLDDIEDHNIEAFLTWLTEMDDIEAVRYHEIVVERLTVIDKFQDKLNDDDYEKVLQEYIFDHLWLLDPAWERATVYADLEKQIKNTIDQVKIYDKKSVRPDIRYRRIHGKHVIIELKRPSVRVTKPDIEKQVNAYIHAVKKEIDKDPEERLYPIEGICLLENLPAGWDNHEIRDTDEESLRPYGIRVMTYTELIKNARSSYRKFIEQRAPLAEIGTTVEAIRSYQSS